MPDEKPVSLDQQRQKYTQEIERRLVGLGVNPESARTQAAQNADRLYIAGKGPVRVQQSSSEGIFYPVHENDPLAPLIKEIFHTLDPQEKVAAEEERAAEISRLADAKIASGAYGGTL